MPDLNWEDDAFAVPLLAEAAHDPDEDVRIFACGCLVNKRAEPRLVMALLADAVGSASEEVRFRAAWLLNRVPFHIAGGKVTPLGTQAKEEAMRKEIFALLHRLLDDRSVKVRAAAISTLGEFGADPAAAAALAAAANDKDQGVRLAAATTILRINGPDDPTAASILCGLVADPEPSAIRQAAVSNVVRLTSRKSQEQAIKTLAGMIPRVDPIVLPDVIDCLSAAGPIARVALPSLDKLLDDNEPHQPAQPRPGLSQRSKRRRTPGSWR